MGKYEPTAPWNEDFMMNFHCMVEALQRIATHTARIEMVINNANTNRSQEMEALCERIDEIMTHIEYNALQ